MASASATSIIVFWVLVAKFEFFGKKWIFRLESKAFAALELLLCDQSCNFTRCYESPAY
jgi:hypothetical protein